MACTSFGADSINTVLYDKPLTITQSLTGLTVNYSVPNKDLFVNADGKSLDRPCLFLGAAADGRRRPDAVRNFIVQHKEHLVFSGLCLGTAFTAWMFDFAARRQYDRELQAYKQYTDAGQGSDWDKLWDAVNKERKKTNRYLQKRNAFGITACVIGVSLFWSFAIERD